MKWKNLRGQVPEYTCPTINVVQAYLEDIAPPEIMAVLEQVRRDNSNLRAVAKEAIRELKKYETGDLPL
jgi:hypothetical protein